MVGVIKSITGSGGLITLGIKPDDSDKLVLVYADNGPFVRAAHAAFGDVIVSGHRFDPDSLLDKRIDYRVDDLNVMTDFEPA